MAERGAAVTEDAETEVIIVGGGPVGVGLAIELGQRGVSCTVVERYPQPQPIPKGQNLTQRTMEHFYFWGAEPALRAARTVPPGYGIGGLTAYGTLLGEYQHDWLQRSLVRPFYFQDNERLPQYATEAVLRERVAALPTVKTLYGWTVDAVEPGPSGVALSATPRAGGPPRRLHGAYVVGCDGARSVVREAAGITQTRADHDRLMVLLVFRSEGLHRLLERFPGKSFYNVLHPELKGYWQFFGRVDLGTTWFFHAPVPMDTTKDNFDFRALLYAAAGAEFDVSFEHIGFWDLRFATADRYRAGRAFVAGDAAHSHPPYGGYGINTGFEDAANLGWKLAARLAGWGGDGLLDSYDAERRPVFVSTAADFIEKSIHDDRDFLAAYDPAIDRPAFEQAWRDRLTAAKGEVNAFEPHYEGSPIVWGQAGGTPSAKGCHSFAARAGHHLAPMPLSSGQDVFEALEGGFTLLALDADPDAVRAFQAAADALGMALQVIRDDRTNGRDRCGASLVLVRPDQFVAWAASGVGAVAPADILARAAGRT